MTCDMRKRLLLITHGFPFGESEQSFLSTEAFQLAQDFDLVIAAINPSDSQVHPFPEAKAVYQISLTSLRNLRQIGAFFRLFQPRYLFETFRALSHVAAPKRKRCLIDMFSYNYHIWQAKNIIRKIIETEKIDIVYSFWCNVQVIAALELKRHNPTLKVVTRFHGADLYVERSSFDWQPYREIIAQSTDALVFACDAGKQYFTSHWGGDKKAVVSYLGCYEFPRRLPQRDGVLRLVSCSNLIPLKRVHLIIQALALLPETMAVEWHHLGEGTERLKLEQMADCLFSSRSNISWKFWGAIPHHDLGKIYQEICPDWFITTSSTEGGAPVSIQEAFSMGIPAIGTKVGGIPELIRDGATGILLPSNPTAEEVSQAITRAFQFLPHLESMSEAAHAEWVRKLDGTKNAQSFSLFLKNMVR